jgi:hypothetical protein
LASASGTRSNKKKPDPHEQTNQLNIRSSYADINERLELNSADRSFAFVQQGLGYAGSEGRPQEQREHPRCTNFCRRRSGNRNWPNHCWRVVYEKRQPRHQHDGAPSDYSKSALDYYWIALALTPQLALLEAIRSETLRSVSGKACSADAHACVVTQWAPADAIRQHYRWMDPPSRLTAL